MRSRLLAVVATLLLAAGCGGEAYEEHSVSELEGALERAGLQICRAESASRRIENTDGERWLDVAVDCADERDETIVDVIAWPDQAARDHALRRFEAQNHPTSQNHGITWAFGQYTVHVSGAREDAVVEKVADAMDELGAS